MIRFLTISPKGGVGKSAFSQQVAATYLLKLEGVSTLVELNDYDLASAWLTESSIETWKVEVEGNPSLAIGDVFEKLAGKSFALDINTPSVNPFAALDSLDRLGVLSRFNAIFVPVCDVGEDLNLAAKTVDKILEYAPDANVILVLNRVSTRRADRRKVRYGKVLDYVEKKELLLLEVPFIQDLNLYENFGKTLCELDDLTALADIFSLKANEADKARNSEASFEAMVMLEAVNGATDGRAEICRLHELITDLISPQEGS